MQVLKLLQATGSQDGLICCNCPNGWHTQWHTDKQSVYFTLLAYVPTG